VVSLTPFFLAKEMSIGSLTVLEYTILSDFSPNFLAKAISDLDAQSKPAPLDDKSSNTG